jgi:hypothetical protein
MEANGRSKRDRPRWQLGQRARTLLGAVHALAGVTLFGFLVAVITLGGSARLGKIADGQHFLSSDGQLKQVDASTYSYLWWHETILLFSMPLWIVVVLILFVFSDKRASPR